MKSLTIALLLLVVPSALLAKERQYEMGKVSKLTVKSGRVDTTTCSGPEGDVHCSGGIHDDYTDIYLLTMSDGVQARISHIAMRPDPIKALSLGDESSVDIQYRIEHKRGLGPSIDYAVIVDPTNPKKEGWYRFETLKKPTK